MCSNASVLLYTSHTNRKILDRVLRSKRTFLVTVRGRTSCLASGHQLRRMIIHASAVNLSKFRMFARWYRVGSSNCSLNNIPLVSNCSCLCCGIMLWASGLNCECVHFSWFLTCTYNLHRHRSCSSVPFGNDVSHLDKPFLLD